MKTKLIHILSLWCWRRSLQVTPLLRSVLPSAQGIAPNAWGFILKIGVGATALLGFDSISKASGIAISPANALRRAEFLCRHRHLFRWSCRQREFNELQRHLFGQSHTVCGWSHY